LGNTYYLLGDFESAIECHGERLMIAKEYGDRAAERRAYSNLGNAYIFMGKFNEATDFYLYVFIFILFNFLPLTFLTHFFFWFI
jgi:hypothetical protein